MENTTENPLDTLVDLFDSFTENLPRRQQQENDPAPAQAEWENDSSPSAAMVFGHAAIQTMDNTQVNHGIESMINKTTLDKHGRMKNTP